MEGPAPERNVIDPQCGQSCPASQESRIHKLKPRAMAPWPQNASQSKLTTSSAAEGVKQQEPPYTQRGVQVSKTALKSLDFYPQGVSMHLTTLELLLPTEMNAQSSETHIHTDAQGCVAWGWGLGMAHSCKQPGYPSLGGQNPWTRHSTTMSIGNYGG